MQFKKFICIILSTISIFLFSACSQNKPELFARYQSMGNSDAKIVFVLMENGSFNLRLEIINIDTANDVILYKGKWTSVPGDHLNLNFDPEDTKEKNPVYLFYDGNGAKMPANNSVNQVSQYQCKFGQYDPCIYIWNIMSCRKK